MNSFNSALVVLGDFALAQRMNRALISAGFETLSPCEVYEDALRALSDHRPRFCVFDIDLGHRVCANPDSGEAGRRLLALLNGRRCKAVVWTDADVSLSSLRALHPDVELVSRSTTPETIAGSLARLRAA